MRRFAFVGALLGFLCVGLSHADTPSPGYSLAERPLPVTESVTATLSTGEILTFDGQSLDLWTASGAPLLQLGMLAADNYPSFVCVDPTETFAAVGESSNGHIYKVMLDGTGVIPLGTLWFNYDAAFESGNELLVSAAVCGYGCGNSLIRLSTDTGAATLVVSLEGPSGPLAFDLDGNLLYAAQDPNIPPAPASTSILFFPQEDLDSGLLLSEADAYTISAGFDGASSLAVDPVRGDLYLAETNYDIPTNRLRRVESTEALSPILLEGLGSETISNLEFEGGDGLALFSPFQPDSSGILRYNTTDFFFNWSRRELSTARARCELSGPGSITSGAVDLVVTEGPSLGNFLVIWGALAGGPLEDVYQVAGTPMFTPISSPSLKIINSQFSLDAFGEGQFSFEVPDTVPHGLLGFQAVIFEGAFQLHGSSTHDVL